MLWRLVAVSVLLTLAGRSEADEVPEDLSFIKDMIDPYETCQFGTLSCKENCTGVQICLGGGIYDDVEICAGDSKCDARNNSCVAGLTTCNVVDEDKFTCHGAVGGNFPNPYDCHSYFVCPDPTISTTTTTTTTTTTKKPFLSEELRAVAGEKHICNPNTTAFDALSGTCRFNSNHRVCKESPVPKCTAQLQSGALIENPNIYYVCVSISGVLQPWLIKCSNATDIFQDGKCVTPDYLHQPRWVATD